MSNVLLTDAEWLQTALTVKASDPRRDLRPAAVGAIRSNYYLTREGKSPMRAAIDRMGVTHPDLTYRERHAIVTKRLAKRLHGGLTYKGRPARSD